jgi:hypothetical protein
MRAIDVRAVFSVPQNLRLLYSGLTTSTRSQVVVIKARYISDDSSTPQKVACQWADGVCRKVGKKWFPKTRSHSQAWICHDDMYIVSALQKTLYEVNFKGIICPAGSMWIITVPSFPQRVSAALLNQFTKSARVCGILFNSRSEIPWSTYRQFVRIYPSAPRTSSQGGNKDEECPRATTCRGSSLHFA